MSSNAQWSDLVSGDRSRTIAAANSLLPAWISLIIVILIGWQLATIVWMFVPGPAAGAPVAVPAGQQQMASAASGPGNTQVIADAHIFGEAIIYDEPPPDDIPENLDETNRRDLRLRGTIASDRPEYSIAIIADASNDENVFVVGEAVAAGARLHAVKADHVVLDEGGVLSRLSLVREYSSQTSPSIQRTTSTRQTTDARGRDSIQSVVAQNVAQLADVIRPTPYFVNGQQQGYRVYPGRDRRRFAELGLRPGDLIREIDGQSLTDPTQAMQIFQSLGTASQVSVTVERDGTPETIVLNTEQLDLSKDE